MSLDRERAIASQWRTIQTDGASLAQFKVRAAHKVDECSCFTCELCRSVESCLAEIDRITGAGFEESHGGTPLGT